MPQHTLDPALLRAVVATPASLSPLPEPMPLVAATHAAHAFGDTRAHVCAPAHRCCACACGAAAVADASAVRAAAAAIGANPVELSDALCAASRTALAH
eukprot:1046534-Pleurochrysis_carterae.AAC.2